jgi:electron transfer flavoprotein alpha subunit
MKNVLVYCELQDGQIASISKELLSAGKKLALKLGVNLDAMAFGVKTDKVAEQIAPYGVDTVYTAAHPQLEPYTTLPHAELAVYLLKKEAPQIVLFGATSTGRDLAPRVASAVGCGLTADTTILDIGDHYVSKEKKTYENLLYAIRPAFGGSIIANIKNPPALCNSFGIQLSEYMVVDLNNGEQHVPIPNLTIVLCTSNSCFARE